MNNNKFFVASAILLFLVFVTSGCAFGKNEIQEASQEEVLTLADALPSSDLANVRFGGGGKVGWLNLPKASSFDISVLQGLPECGGEVVQVLGKQIGLGDEWNDAIDPIEQACTQNGKVVFMTVEEFLTEMPSGETDCLDYCDNTAFGIIDVENRLIKWSGTMTVGMRSESSLQECKIDGLAQTNDDQDVVLFVCWSVGGRLNHWYAATTNADVEPLWKVMWLESAKRNEYTVLIDELVDDFRTQPETIN